MSQMVEINECFARDGLQHESGFVDTREKIRILNDFVNIGFRRIEATSYSHPKKVPAFADCSTLLEQLPRHPGVFFKATCPNPKAVERALADHRAGHGAEEISLLSSASDAHSQKNLGADKRAQWTKLAEMAEMADRKFRLVGVISVAFGCPFEGHINPETVAEDVRKFRNLGAEIITIGDTTGLANPAGVRGLFELIMVENPGFPFVAHFHNTRGAGLANALAAYEAGCTRFDTAMGGVGGHPAQIEYGSGNTGNIATEDTVNLFESMGISTGLNLDRLQETSVACERILGRQLNSQVARAGFSGDILNKVGANV